MEKIQKYTGDLVDIQELCDLLTRNGYRLVRDPDYWDDYRPFPENDFSQSHNDVQEMDDDFDCDYENFMPYDYRRLGDESNAIEETRKTEIFPNYFVIDELIQWRTTISKENNLPASRVLNNKVIKRIAVNMPSTLEELLEIYGVGPATVERYGQDVLEVVECCRLKLETLSSI